MAEPPKLLEYVGVIHIHTNDSDGTKTHEQIIKLAQEYNIDFLMFADHMTLTNKRKENWYDRTLVVVGYEHQDKEQNNHYLVYGLDEPLSGELLPAQYVRLVNQAGGFGVIAHPDETRDFKEYPPLPWTDWSVRDFDGIEIWNHMSAWLEGVASGKNKVKYLFYPRSLLIAPCSETLAKWDRLSMRRRVVGIAAADAHGHKYKLIGPIWRTIFPYKVELQSLRTHIVMKEPLSKDFLEAKSQLFRAFRYCRAFASNYRWGDATGFRFWAETPKMYAIIGDRIVINSKLRLFVKSPMDAKIRLIRNGELLAEADGTEADFPANKLGIYRVELWRNDKGWVFSNHIRVVPPERDMRQRTQAHHYDKPPKPKQVSTRRPKRNDERRKKDH